MPRGYPGFGGSSPRRFCIISFKGVNGSFLRDEAYSVFKFTIRKGEI